MAWLLDTNVLSELRKPQGEQKVLRFVASTPLSDLYVSVVSLAEIRYGIELNIGECARTCAALPARDDFASGAQLSQLQLRQRQEPA